MRQYIYTKREVQIVKTQRPLVISDEEFLTLYRKAFMRDNIAHLNHLGNVYPDIEDRVFSDEFEKQHRDPADREEHYLHPIFCPTNRCTEGRIKDMVCYLTGAGDWSNSQQQQLCDTVPFRLVFNYWLDEYVKDYDAYALWNTYFLGQEKLSSVIALRGINGLDVLVYRTMEYYDRCVKSSCAECGIGYHRVAKKPRRKVCSKNGVKRIFSGLGVPTSGLEFL